MCLAALTMKTSLLLQRGEESTRCQINLKHTIIVSKLFQSSLRSRVPVAPCSPSLSLCRSQGLVVVWELQLERRGRPERVSVSWEHRAQAITALCWDTSALRVFVGDSTGRVTFLRAGSSKLGKVGGDRLHDKFYALWICRVQRADFFCVLPAGVSVCHVSHPDCHHRGLQGGAAGLSRRPPAGVLPEPLLPL